MASENAWMNTYTTTYKPIKKRLDILLTEAGHFPSSEKARAAVMAGLVRLPHQLLDKPGIKLKELPKHLHIQKLCPYVSRGGLKLKKALETFKVEVNGVICLDIGSSTGGFTDCLLQNGAKHIYAVDVGYGQLDWSLRNHPQVTSREKVNARYLTSEDLYPEHSPKAQLAVMDVSFISILKILPALFHLLADDGYLVSLLKPQFEAEAHQNEKGIVKSAAVRLEVLERIQSKAPESGMYLHKVISSPIHGRGGNQEFLGVFYKYPPSEDYEIKI